MPFLSLVHSVELVLPHVDPQSEHRHCLRYHQRYAVLQQTVYCIFVSFVSSLSGWLGRTSPVSILQTLRNYLYHQKLPPPVFWFGFFSLHWRQYMAQGPLMNVVLSTGSIGISCFRGDNNNFVKKPFHVSFFVCITGFFGFALSFIGLVAPEAATDEMVVLSPASLAITFVVIDILVLFPLRRACQYLREQLFFIFDGGRFSIGLFPNFWIWIFLWSNYFREK